ncbi:MAG: PrsW family intramembrane metalloprotease, partial [Patescibacteria group bacterium]
FYILLGLLPSFIWLSFYLKKDKKPEPNSMILKVFALGMFMAPLAIILELFLIWLLNPNINPFNILSQIPQASLIKITLAATLIPALVEEYLKYAVVKFRVLKYSAFDEPTDTMIYCIIAGLGFAAVENLMVLIKISGPGFSQALSTITFRFLGATLVHALGSGIVGYWLAKGLLYLKHKRKMILIGLGLAIFFHSCYNYFILNAFEKPVGNQQMFFIFLAALLLISAALLISYYFRKLKKQQSICKI